MSRTVPVIPSRQHFSNESPDAGGRRAATAPRRGHRSRLPQCEPGATRGTSDLGTPTLVEETRRPLPAAPLG